MNKNLALISRIIEHLEIELRRKNIPFISQQEIEILYDGIPLTKKYVADLVCYNKIII